MGTWFQLQSFKIAATFRPVQKNKRFKMIIAQRYYLVRDQHDIVLNKYVTVTRLPTEDSAGILMVTNEDRTRPLEFRLEGNQLVCEGPLTITVENLEGQVFLRIATASGAVPEFFPDVYEPDPVYEMGGPLNLRVAVF